MSRRPRWPRRLLRVVRDGPVAVLAIYQAGTVAYVSALTVAAALRRPAPPPANGPPKLRFVVLIPAHDEELGIGETLDALARLEYPRELYSTVVIADNCTDQTAKVSRSGGARVLERHDCARPGKGEALAWAMQRLEEDGTPFDVVVVLDADCEASHSLLRAIEGRIAAGANAVQVDNVVKNPEASTASSLRFAGFRLINTLRPMGKAALGLSVGLQGTGMAFTRELMRRQPWDAYSIVEDQEHHLKIVELGERVVFAPETQVQSAMPTSLRRSTSQQSRWESGRFQMAMRWAPRMVAKGLRRGDLHRLHAGLELLVPPQSVVILASGTLAAAAKLTGRPAIMRLAIGCLGAQVAHVVGGLAVVGAPASTYRSLLAAPVLIVHKVGVLAWLVAGGSPTKFVRTEREAQS